MPTLYDALCQSNSEYYLKQLADLYELLLIQSFVPSEAYLASPQLKIDKEADDIALDQNKILLKDKSEYSPLVFYPNDNDKPRDTSQRDNFKALGEIKKRLIEESNYAQDLVDGRHGSNRQEQNTYLTDELISEIKNNIMIKYNITSEGIEHYYDLLPNPHLLIGYAKGNFKPISNCKQENLNPVEGEQNSQLKDQSNKFYEDMAKLKQKDPEIVKNLHILHKFYNYDSKEFFDLKVKVNVLTFVNNLMGSIDNIRKSMLLEKVYDQISNVMNEDQQSDTNQYDTSQAQSEQSPTSDIEEESSDTEANEEQTNNTTHLHNKNAVQRKIMNF